MEFVAVFNELLLTVLARADWGPEIPHFGCLECGTKRVERRIHIIGFFPYRAIVDSMGKTESPPGNGVPAGCPGSFSTSMQNPSRRYFKNRIAGASPPSSSPHCCPAMSQYFFCCSVSGSCIVKRHPVAEKGVSADRFPAGIR